MNEHNVIEIKDLSVDFMTVRGIVYAVQGVDLSVKEGEIHGVVGESGCGKSVSTKSIMRLHDEKHTRYSGQILFKNGEGKEVDVLSLSEKQMQTIQGKDIAMIFQDPMTSLDPIMKAGEQIAELVRKKLKMKKAEAKEYVLTLFEKVGILPAEQRYEQYPFEMSGGMLQRVMIAMALSCKPRLLIADEPTTALDVTIQAQILELMQSLQEKLGMAIIMVTHDLGVIASMCDEIIVMYGGRVCERGTADAIFYSPAHEYTKGLLRSIPTKTNSKTRLVPIGGTPINMLNMPKGCAFCPRCDAAMKICLTEKPEEIWVGEDHLASCWMNIKNMMEEGKSNE